MRTAELLHLARGALKIVEIHGAALLAEEMEQTCRRLAEPGEHAKDEQGLEALTRAMVQLPAYLERLLGGGKDVALVLLPLLNDLRQARDKPLAVGRHASAAERGAVRASPRGACGRSGAGRGTRGFEKVAQRLRPAFQSALLGWIKGNDVGKHLDELLRVSLGLERAAATDQVRQLWTVIVAVLTAIRAGGLEATVTLKRLLGQADRQLKRLIDGGEPAIVNAPPVDLINSLLYYVARSTTDDTRITKLRDIYGLSDMLPAEEQLEQAREGLAGPSIKLMRTVAHAIKEDLGAVKDVLDIFVRTGMQDIEKLGPQLELLKKIGDTLGVLGLERARSQIQRETQELGAIVASNKTVDRAALERGRRDAARGRGRARPRARERRAAGRSRIARRRGGARHTAAPRHASRDGRVHRESREDQGGRDPARRPARRRARARPSEAAAARDRRGPPDARQDEGAASRRADRRRDRDAARAERRYVQARAFGAARRLDRRASSTTWRR